MGNKINVPIIELDNITLREIKRSDYFDMYDYGKDEETCKYISWGPYKSVDDALWSVENIFLKRPIKNMPTGHAIIYKENNKMIGTCDFAEYYPEKQTGEIGYVINKEYWGKGIVTKACKAVMKYGFEDLNLEKITIRHHPLNIGSKKVILKCGFRYIDNRSTELFNGIKMPWYEITKEEYYEL